MFSFKRCFLGIGLVLFGCAAATAAPPLTTVQDILFNADGTRFNGVANISWQSFQASDMSNISAHSISTQIVNGLLRVQLVPTTNALSPASYSVVYNSDGSTQFMESWGVPPSSVPVRVRDIRIGGAGTTVGGTTPPAVLNTVNIGDVVGLSAALNLRATIGTGYTPSRAAVIDAGGALDGAIGNASDCVHVDGSSGPCGTGTGSTGSTLAFVDGEIPSGTANGTNATFQLGNVPSPVASLAVFRNGLRLKQGGDYTLSNNVISFIAAAIPQANDILLASYRLGINPAGLSFVDSEIPTGTVDGSNTVFTVALPPSPATSLALYRNGLRLRANLDYTLTGASLVFLAGQAPQPGDVLVCSYRIGSLQLN